MRPIPSVEPVTKAVEESKGGGLLNVKAVLVAIKDASKQIRNEDMGVECGVAETQKLVFKQAYLSSSTVSSRVITVVCIINKTGLDFEIWI